MTENDKELLRQSETLTSIDWGTADAFAKKADSLEVRQQLKDLSTTLYHKEQYYIGLL